MNLRWTVRLRKKEVRKTKYYPKYWNCFLSELWFFWFLWLMGWNIRGNLSGERLCVQLTCEPKGSGMKRVYWENCAAKGIIINRYMNPRGQVWNLQMTNAFKTKTYATIREIQKSLKIRDSKPDVRRISCCIGHNNQ